MSASSYIVGACLLWLLVCARLWWMIGSKNQWQRHLIALGAGLGAALIYTFGHLLGAALSVPSQPAPTPATGADIRIAPGVPKKASEHQ